MGCKSIAGKPHLDLERTPFSFRRDSHLGVGLAPREVGILSESHYLAVDLRDISSRNGDAHGVRPLGKIGFEGGIDIVRRGGWLIDPNPFRRLPGKSLPG